MNIPPVNPENSFQIPKTRAKHAKSETQRNEAAQDSVKTVANDTLLKTLRTDPEVRPEMVERGQNLASDPNYPASDLVANLADLFVRGFRK